MFYLLNMCKKNLYLLIKGCEVKILTSLLTEFPIFLIILSGTMYHSPKKIFLLRSNM